MGLTICKQFSIKFHFDISLFAYKCMDTVHSKHRNATFRILCSSAVPNNNSQSINNSQLKWLVCSCDMNYFISFLLMRLPFPIDACVCFVAVFSLFFTSFSCCRRLLFIRCDTIVVLISNDFLRAHTHFNITSSLYLPQRGKSLLQMLNIPCENFFFYGHNFCAESEYLCLFIVCVRFMRRLSLVQRHHKALFTKSYTKIKYMCSK